MRTVTRILTLGLCLAAAIPACAMAHAFPKHTDPGAGAELQAPPPSVTMTFTEEVEPAFSSITVTDTKGARFDKGDTHTDTNDATRLTVDLKPMQAGAYKVAWHATSVDTHRTQGHFAFTVAAGAAPVAIPLVSGAWARPTPPGLDMAAVYVTIQEPAGGSDKLTGISTPAAASAEMHETVETNAVSQMVATGPVALSPGAAVQFAPYGKHIMLTGLKAPLQLGQRFPLILHFAKAGDISVPVTVAQAAPGSAPAAPAAGSGDGGMAGMKM